MSFEKVNSKVVKAALPPGGAVLAKRGAMLAYTGRVTFSPVHGSGGGQGGGMGGGMGGMGGLMGMAGRAMAGESVPMMAAQGAGEVYYGVGGHHVTVIDLDGSGVLSVEADRLLAHDATLASSVVFLGQQGGIRGAVRGAVSGQGLFTTQLSGHGSVAVMSHGGTIALPIHPGGATAVDPQAYVAHVGQVSVDVSANVGWREAVGRGAGEAIQLKLTGSGTVYVQASERKFQ